MIRVALIEDIKAILAGQEKFLGLMGDIEILYSCSSVEEFQDLYSKNPKKIDVIVSDIGLPGKSGIEGIGWMKSKSPSTEFIMVSVFTDNDNIFKALCAGAVGYLAKNTSLQELYEGIKSVINGGSPMTPSIARKVIHYFNPIKTQHNNKLSAKEEQVVQCIVEGLSYKLIADRMGISINTVRHHIRNIYTKLHINSKAELITRSLSGVI